MRWDYNSNYRDRFDEGPHRDILIVPHATIVTPVAGGPPEVRSKVPVFSNGEDPTDPNNGGPIPGKYQDLEFVITNEDIIKEKFEFVDSINSNDNLAFGSCEAAMVKFTIRNNKTYNSTSKQWELDIPNLETFQIVSEDGKTLVGEVLAHAVIHVYSYIDGDSSTLMWHGMYAVEQDKASNNGYEREITAYNFMLTLRDMDIFAWYRALFKGVPIDSEDLSKGYKPKSETGKPIDNLTIGKALKDLFENLTVFSPDKPTVTNPKDYLNDMDVNDYPGYGMPIIIDPDIFDTSVPEIVLPTSSGDNQYERYGYMPILELPMYEDEKIMKKESLSAGKFLEDIARLAGRFGMIRCDKMADKDSEYSYSAASKTHYNLYEKCILTFRPLVNKGQKVVSENVFDNSDVQKGFQYDYYDTKEIKLIDIYNYDAKRLIFYCPTGMTKKEKKAYQAGTKYDIGTMVISDNMFTSYLKTDNAKHKDVITILEKGKSGYYGGKPILQPLFDAIINRPYRPYQLTTSGDLCRMPGDYIKVSGIDRITGEEYEFYSYILCRKAQGIQKMMDTYTAKGDVGNRTYSDYRSGTAYDSFSPQSFGYGKTASGGSGYISSEQSGEVVQGMTPDDLIEYLRNIGFRFPDEPTDVDIVFDRKEGQVQIKWTDPEDIETSEPAKSIWAGTVVVRKEKSAPKHRWDGTLIVDTSTPNEYQTDALVDDNNIEGNTKYYYGIFPYDTKGDYRYTKVVSIDTTSISDSPKITEVKGGGTKDWNGSEIDIIWCGNNNKLTVQISSNQYVFKMYAGETEIYSFTSPVGTTVADAKKIHVAFLENDANQIAKPSFIYHTGNGTYSYNQEEPTDSQMSSIYSWLHP